MIPTDGESLRRLHADDIPAVQFVEAEAYIPELLESDAFLQLIRLFPAGALGYFDAGGLCGYAFGTPCRAATSRVPLDSVPADADAFYIHDVAVASRCRGRGIGRVLATALLAVGRAQGFTRLELVAVQDSVSFWRRFGFESEYEFEYVPGVPSVKMAFRQTDVLAT